MGTTAPSIIRFNYGVHKFQKPQLKYTWRSTSGFPPTIREWSASHHFGWIIPMVIGFVETSRVDIYVGLDLECWGQLALQQSDLIAGYINLWPPCRSTGGCEALYGGGVICVWYTFATRETYVACNSAWVCARKLCMLEIIPTKNIVGCRNPCNGDIKQNWTHRHSLDMIVRTKGSI